MNATEVSTFADWVGGQPFGFAPGASVSTFCLDSNSVQPGDLFLAIRGERVDGHDFVPQALERGAVGALVERPTQGPHILVPHLVDALAKLAVHYRSSFDGPVLAITGSAGKTTTKEFVAAALSSFGPILKTPGNRNSEYTAPLVWTELNASHRAVVVEMAMRGFGQIRHLAALSKPTIGLITNIGYAHMEMVGSREGVADAKGELLEVLPGDGIAILWHEDEYLARLRKKTGAKVKTFGFSPEATCRITGYRAESWTSSVVQGELEGAAWTAHIPSAGKHIAANAAAAVLAASVVGVGPTQAAADIEKAVLPPLRMEVVDFQGATVILDTYNASPPSMIGAIETLSELPVDGRRFAVIGEMRELGPISEAAHREVGRAVGNASFHAVLLYGEPTHWIYEEAVRNGQDPETVTHGTSIADVENFLSQIRPGDVVLIKGSRSLELERALPSREAHS